MFERLNPILPKSDKSATEAFKTGDWRTLKPVVREKNSACCFGCPIHNRIRDCFQLAIKEEFEKAWQKIIETNPLPAVLGRVCPHPCETECLRKDFDQSLAINTIERLLGETALEKNWKPKGFSELSPRLNLKRRIAIIGGGPAGLAAAYQLRRMGRWVEIFEAEKKLGGMLYFGIPAYRLEKSVLAREIENNILSLGGIEVKTGVKIESSVWPEIAGDFDAVLIAIGNQKSRKFDLEIKTIKGKDSPKIVNGLEFLRKNNFSEKPDIGDIVAVVGGGNTAVDAARVAKMNGAKCVVIVYRRREEDMPAFSDEIKAAKEEGVEIMPLTLPICAEEASGGFLRIDCLKMALGEQDKTGRPIPIPKKGILHTIFVHSLIIAVGEETDLSFTENIKEEKILFENVFLAGDASYGGAGTVAAAVGSGNKAAEEIDFYLETGRRKSLVDIIKPEEKIVGFSDLNAEYFDFIFPQAEGYLAEKRKPEDRIREEARRCFSCGVCNQCGNCWLYCPDVAVSKISGEECEINYEYCKGCGICANECPRNVIDMEKGVSR